MNTAIDENRPIDPENVSLMPSKETKESVMQSKEPKESVKVVIESVMQSKEPKESVDVDLASAKKVPWRGVAPTWKEYKKKRGKKAKKSAWKYLCERIRTENASKEDIDMRNAWVKMGFRFEKSAAKPEKKRTPEAIVDPDILAKKPKKSNGLKLVDWTTPDNHSRLLAAIRTMNEKGTSKRQVSKQFSIPRTVLSRYIERLGKKKRIGAPAVLDNVIEREISEYIKYRADYGHGIDGSFVQAVARAWKRDIQSQ